MISIRISFFFLRERNKNGILFWRKSMIIGIQIMCDVVRKQFKFKPKDSMAIFEVNGSNEVSNC